MVSDLPLRRGDVRARATFAGPPSSLISAFVSMRSINSQSLVYVNCELPNSGQTGRIINPVSNNTDMKERLNELLGPEFWEEFGRRLGKAIDESPHKPAHIAKHLHCSPAHISKAVSSGSISLQALTAIAIFLNKSLDEMVFGNKSLLPAAGQKFAGEVKDWLAKAPAGLLPAPVLEAIQEAPVAAKPEQETEAAGAPKTDAAARIRAQMNDASAEVERAEVDRRRQAK